MKPGHILVCTNNFGINYIIHTPGTIATFKSKEKYSLLSEVHQEVTLLVPSLKIFNKIKIFIMQAQNNNSSLKKRGGMLK